VVRQQPLCDIGDQYGVAYVGVTGADFFNRQVVGQVAGADDFYAVVKDEQGVSGFLCAGRINDSEGFRYLDLEI
jgi:hypothetical protein